MRRYAQICADMRHIFHFNSLHLAALLARSKRNVSTFFQQIGGFFYVTTLGGSTLTGVGTIMKLCGLQRTWSAGCPSSGLIATCCGGRRTTDGGQRTLSAPECVNLYPTVEAIFPDYGKPALGTSTVGG